MAKLSKEERAEKVARKKEERKNAVSRITNKDKKEFTYHSFLMILKMFFCLTQFLSLVQIVYEVIEGAEMTTLRYCDAVLYLVMVVLLGHSIVKHKSHSGVYSFFMYGIVELGMYYLAGYIAHTQGLWTQEIKDNLVYYTIGSCILYIPTLIYYIHRWNNKEIFTK